MVGRDGPVAPMVSRRATAKLIGALGERVLPD